MARIEARRACRHRVKWPARVRSIADSTWHPAQIINLSVTGVLLRTEQAYEIGERVEVEIDFLTHPEFTTVVTGVGYVVRDDCEEQCAAIHFDLGCTPTMRATSPPAGRDARP
jgi:Tfp pilus assembly protein PilZ